MYMGQLIVRFYVVIIDLMLQSATPITSYPLPLQSLLSVVYSVDEMN